MGNNYIISRLGNSWLKKAEAPVEESKTPSKKKGPPAQWDEFMKAKYQDGKRKVPNPNPDTRSKFPQVVVTTALKDKAFMGKIMKEYYDWVSKNKKPSAPKKDKPEEKAAPAKTPAKEETPKPEAPKKEEEAPKAKEAPQLSGDMKDYKEFGALWERNKIQGMHQKAVKAYTGAAYRSINSALRNGNQPSPQNDLLIQTLDEVFEMGVSRMPRDLAVTRGVGPEHPLADLLKSGELQPGFVIEDKGFMSTSITPANKWSWDDNSGLSLVITVPKGSKALYVGDPPDEEYSNFGEEKELILPRGTKTRVTRIDQKTKQIFLEVV